MPLHQLISIIDDDQPFRESMGRLLKLLGYAVESFPSAASFLSSPILRKTACLVTDVNMPGMTGLELHRHLTNAGISIPTIVVTAYPEEATRKSALRDGITCYLAKPVDDEQLESCIRSALGGPTNHGS